MIHTEDIQAGMEVLDASEKHVGVVHSVEGDAIILVDADSEKSVVRSSVPLAWVDSVGKVVRLHISCDEVRRASQGTDQPVRHPLAQEAEHGPGTV